MLALTRVLALATAGAAATGKYVPPTPSGDPQPWLAADNADAVPAALAAAGKAVLDDVKAAVLGAFVRVDVSVPDGSGGEYARLMSAESLNLTALEPRLNHSEYPTVQAFVDASVWACAQNPILVQVAAEWSRKSDTEKAASYPAASPERAADIRSAVTLAYIETVVASAAMHEPQRPDGGVLHAMIEIFTARREAMTHDGVPEWRKFSDAFEELKRVSVDAAVATMLEYKKQGAHSDELFLHGMKKLVTFGPDGKPEAHAEVNSGVLLMANIVEAMYEDVRRVWQHANNKTVPVTAPICGEGGRPPQNPAGGPCVCFGGDAGNDTQCGPPSSGSWANAEAGAALILHPSKLLIPHTNKHRQCDSGPNSNQKCDGVLWAVPSTAAAMPVNESAQFFSGGANTGAFHLSSPFPAAWNNLYNSWNGAFVSGYVDGPVFYSKLFNPLVAGYYHQDAQTMYMWPRAFTLYMIIQYMNVLERVRLGRNMVTNVQWNRPVLTELWGGVNNKAATEYRARVAGAWNGAPIAWQEGGRTNMLYDAIRDGMIKLTYLKMDTIVGAWHGLADLVSEGATLSNHVIAAIVSIASAMTGLDEA
eukprot:TRINITY_DN2615_c0_g1_i1.p1 TRINITY_DN2615_c0_g1~~TRINITY_DN2615_c0_g1_i1.p1  ORF type:complete len:591 (+),score=167.34 TRINITY_DN2615_c0_g1_i1:77-1849(+)